jgi:uncharacterized NAD-dependent epimerase/dehydratase family protein
MIQNKMFNETARECQKDYKENSLSNKRITYILLSQVSCIMIHINSQFLDNHGIRSIQEIIDRANDINNENTMEQ